MTWDQKIMESEAKGEAKGITKGKLDDAAKMKVKGMSVADIMDIIGLTVEQIAED